MVNLWGSSTAELLKEFRKQAIAFGQLDGRYDDEQTYSDLENWLDDLEEVIVRRSLIANALEVGNEE